MFHTGDKHQKLTDDPRFHVFFNQLDNFSTAYFLWVTAHGFEGSYERKDKGETIPKELEDELGDDNEDPGEGEG